jgi:HOOK domain
VDLHKALLLLLGCAVHCERKEFFIEKIKTLDIDVQQEIVEAIKQASHRFDTGRSLSKKHVFNLTCFQPTYKINVGLTCFHTVEILCAEAIFQL